MSIQDIPPRRFERDERDDVLMPRRDIEVAMKSRMNNAAALLAPGMEDGFDPFSITATGLQVGMDLALRHPEWAKNALAELPDEVQAMGQRAADKIVGLVKS